jgi:ubiquitin carboxyl-terminal hydrolase 22/27/51
VAPEVLTIDIKRVRQAASGAIEKNTDRCIFPEYIDMHKYMQNSGAGSCMYRLTSIVAHHGNINGGHYISFVNRNGQWFKCNDSQVEKVSWSDIEKLFAGHPDGFHATMLSFEQCNP